MKQPTTVLEAIASSWSHAVLGVMIQLPYILVALVWHQHGLPYGWLWVWLGAGAAIHYFAGREIAQAEYRYIEPRRAADPSYGRDLMPLFIGLDVRLWTLHSCTDLLVPSGLVCAIATASNFLL